MNYTTLKPSAIALSDIPIFLPTNLKTVERIGLTQNASRTPYAVYWTNSKRCSIFFKRSVLFWLLQLLLALKHQEIVNIKRIDVASDGVQVFTQDKVLVLSQAEVCSFLEQYHLMAHKGMVALIGADDADRKYQVNSARCSCQNIGGYCTHKIAMQIQVLNGIWASVAKYMRSRRATKTDMLLCST